MYVEILTLALSYPFVVVEVVEQVKDKIPLDWRTDAHAGLQH